jgi:hypothetical protein
LLLENYSKGIRFEFIKQVAKITYIEDELDNIMQLESIKMAKHTQNLELLKKFLLPHVQLLQCGRNVATFHSFLLLKLQELLTD